VKLYFVSGNEMKAREVARIMPGVERISLDLPEIQSLDPEEVIKEKLLEAHRLEPTKTLVVEDGTYSIKGLGGLPGTLVKWFVSSVGPAGIYEMVGDKDPETTVCANLGLVKPSGEIKFFVGEIKGKTVLPAGGEGFHFDSIFMPDGHDKRFAEMTRDEKDAISHRGIAWQKLKESISK